MVQCDSCSYKLVCDRLDLKVFRCARCNNIRVNAIENGNTKRDTIYKQIAEKLYKNTDIWNDNYLTKVNPLIKIKDLPEDIDIKTQNSVLKGGENNAN
jgi:hypothetical protein